MKTDTEVNVDRAKARAEMIVSNMEAIITNSVSPKNAAKYCALLLVVEVQDRNEHFRDKKSPFWTEIEKQIINL